MTATGSLRRKTLTAHNEATMRTVLGALCGCEAVTFHRTATERGFAYDSLDFEGAFTLDVRGRQGDRSVRPHF